MKKTTSLAVVFIAIMLCFSACSSVNDTDKSVGSTALVDDTDNTTSEDEKTNAQERISDVIDDIVPLQNELEGLISDTTSKYLFLVEQDDVDISIIEEYKNAVDDASKVYFDSINAVNNRNTNDSEEFLAELTKLREQVVSETSNIQATQLNIDTYQEQLVDRFITKANELADRGEYSGAIIMLSDSAIYPELMRVKIIETKNVIGEKWIVNTLVRVEDYISAKRYERALEDIEEVLVYFPTDERLLGRKQQIMQDKPVALFELAIVQEDRYGGYIASTGDFYKDEVGDWQKAGEVMTDSFGNLYTGVYQFPTNGRPYYNDDSYAVFNLDRKFKQLNTSIIMRDNSDTDAVSSIHIYVDELLVFARGDITRLTEKIDLELDLTDAKTLKVVASHGNGYSYICLVDAYLQRN